MAYNKEGKVYESSLKATTEWKKKFMKRYSVEFHIEKDASVIAKLSSVPSKIDYIRQLILADIAKESQK